MDWRDHAACRAHDPELFFPVSETGRALSQIGEAKAVCGGCPVVNRCLEWGRAEGIEYGVWGGYSEGERRASRRRRRYGAPPRKVWLGDDAEEAGQA
ncbi:WhiB family transcriptional regulator [Streptomyces sp. NPDC057694]|uniref:WhiB family transcriptional regulator n=1 Tax=Streptomyces sp. NPDC057694 TaxID=3346216 RepID=UPI00369FC379